MGAGERGPFEPTWGGGPKITRKVGGRIVTEALHIRQGQEREEDEMDQLLDGVTRSDLSGPPSGFMRHFLRERRGAAGAGPDVGEKPERGSQRYDSSGGDTPLLQDEENLIEDPGTADLFNEPAARSRREYLDPIDDYMGVTTQPDAESEEDLWLMDEEERLDEYEPRPQRRRHQEPALASARDRDSLVDLFRDE